MKIKEFLEGYNGPNLIIIHDTLTNKRTNLRKEIAIRDFGYYTVREWTILLNGMLKINIQTQF